MTHRERAGDASGQRAGRTGSRGRCGTSSRLSDALTDAHCRFACTTGTAASQGFRTARGFEMGRMACDVPHRRATRSWPKALGNRLYGSLSALLGMRSLPPAAGATCWLGQPSAFRCCRPPPYFSIFSISYQVLGLNLGNFLNRISIVNAYGSICPDRLFTPGTENGTHRNVRGETER